MSADALSFRDAYGRPYQQQVYLSGGANARGSYVDSVEVGFDPPLSPTQQDRVEKVARAELGENAVERVAWPLQGRRVFLSLVRGYYRVESFFGALDAAGLPVSHRGAYYSARLGKVEAPAGSRSPKQHS